MSKPITKEEARNRFLEEVKNTARYWLKQDGDEKYKMEGFIFSIYAMIDGCTPGIPSLDIVLRPHSDDKQFAIDNDDDWYEDGMCINDDVYLHQDNDNRLL